MSTNTNPRYLPEHPPVESLTLSVSDRLRAAIATLKGPLWIPLIDRTTQKVFDRLLNGPGPYDLPTRRVFDVCFYEKGGSLLDGGNMIVRLADEASANALCQRLNQFDPEVRELTWLNTEATFYVPDTSRPDAFSSEVKDCYDLAKAGKGRFWVVPTIVGPK